MADSEQIVRFLTDHGFEVSGPPMLGAAGDLWFYVVAPGNGCYVATNPGEGAGERKETIE